MRRGGIFPVLICATAFGQTFDVASVKPAALRNDPRAETIVRGGPGEPDPGRASFKNIAITNLLMRAYGVKPYQIAGPDWLDREEYDVEVKVPPGTTKAEFNLMLRRLLEERFHLTLRHESREVQAYELVVGKNGSKLNESTPVIGVPGGKFAPGLFDTDDSGFPILDRPGMVTTNRRQPNGTGFSARVTAKAQPVTALVQMLSGQLRCPVSDRTGLAAKYDFKIEYGPETGPAPADADDSLPRLVAAVQEQLGLKLEPKKVPVDVLVIDHVDKVPTEN